MRRLLKSIGNGEKIGDTSTLDDVSAVTEIQNVLFKKNLNNLF